MMVNFCCTKNNEKKKKIFEKINSVRVVRFDGTTSDNDKKNIYIIISKIETKERKWILHDFNKFLVGLSCFYLFFFRRVSLLLISFRFVIR